MPISHQDKARLSPNLWEQINNNMENNIISYGIGIWVVLDHTQNLVYFISIVTFPGPLLSQNILHEADVWDQLPKISNTKQWRHKIISFHRNIRSLTTIQTLTSLKSSKDKILQSKQLKKIMGFQNRTLIWACSASKKRLDRSASRASLCFLASSLAFLSLSNLFLAISFLSFCSLFSFSLARLSS